MCYMMDRVGVRELRQQLSRYLRRVARGETLEVTDRGRPVAVLAPLPEPSSPLATLVAEGRAVMPEGDLLELLPPRGTPSTDLSDTLREDRADRL
jgi:prevent-host-death family protein